MDFFKSKALALGAAAGSVMLAGSAMAQETPIDVTAATGALEQVGVAVAAIGVAMVAAIAAGIAYRWVVAYLAK